MNQDSDKNENRRDGDKSRSFGRRDDARPFRPAGRSGNAPANRVRPRPDDADLPRFGRSDSADTPERSRPRTDNDRPSFNRNNRSGGPAPRSGRSEARSDSPRRDGDSRSERPRSNERPGGSPFGSRGRSDADRTKFGKPAGPPRPSFGRDRNDSDRNRSTDSRPRFDRADRGTTSDQNRNDKPFERPDRPRPAGPDQRRPRDNDRNTGRNDERPRFERNDRPRSAEAGARGDAPRFERRSESDRDRKPTRDTPRPRPFDRDEKSDPIRRSGTNRSDTGRSGDARPRNNQSRPGGAGPGRSDKPFAKRVGGFSREADERNRENWSGGRTPEGRTSSPENRNAGDADRPRDRRSENPGSDSRNTRFTAEQRKDSGERRTGFFVKAPNYELEQNRQRSTVARSADEEPRTARPRTDRYADQASKARQDNDDRKPAGEPGTTRLNRYIANSGVCSRREADELIARGDITVNGKVVTEMGFRVKEGDMVKYGTKALTPERFVYVLLNKPKDYITTTEDPEERKTVMELVADAGNFRMYPVGRLDRKTTGLLLLTNDGELADKLTHPSNEARKIYQVELDKPITEEHFDALKKGIELEDGPIKPDALSIVTPDAYVVGIEIHSGRNRIVRRMFESLGYEVTKLDRTAYAGLTKKELPRGKWRFLDPKEVVKLKYLS